VYPLTEDETADQRTIKNNRALLDAACEMASDGHATSPFIHFEKKIEQMERESL
jgi:hypothetical protein